MPLRSPKSGGLRHLRRPTYPTVLTRPSGEVSLFRAAHHPGEPIPRILGTRGYQRGAALILSRDH